MGIHADLNEAMKIAVREVVDYLVGVLRLKVADAYAFAGLLADFKVAEAVNGNKLVCAALGKKHLRPLVGGADVPVVGDGLRQS
jgi:acetamidase/formamidase